MAPTSALRRISILATDCVFASTLMQAKDFFHMASLRFGKLQGQGLTPQFEIRLISPDGQPVNSFSGVARVIAKGKMKVSITAAQDASKAVSRIRIG